MTKKQENKSKKQTQKQQKKTLKKNHEGNYAFIDNENVNVSIQRMGWKIDRGKLLKRLRRDFGVTKVYLFMGYIPEYQKMYDFFESLGYTLVFRKVIIAENVPQKGNIDTELVLQAMIDIQAYHQAVIVSGDGDFASLTKYLHEQDKLRCVISPNKRRTSEFLEDSADGRFMFLDGYKKRLGYVEGYRDKGDKGDRGNKEEKRKKVEESVEKKAEKKVEKVKSEEKKVRNHGKSIKKTQKKKDVRPKKKESVEDLEPFWM